MTDRDESRDVAILARGERLTRMLSWSKRTELDWHYKGEVLVIRMVPHSDLEAAERERDEARKEVARLVEALGIARRHVEKLAATRVTLCRLRTAIDQAIVNLPKGEA